MTTSTYVLIVASAIAAIVILFALGVVLVNKSFVLLNKGREHRQVEADKIREAATQQTRQVKLNKQWDRADTIDPASHTPETPRTADRREHQNH
jgi:hypothetical protein